MIILYGSGRKDRYLIIVIGKRNNLDVYFILYYKIKLGILIFLFFMFVIYIFYLFLGLILCIYFKR